MKIKFGISTVVLGALLCWPVYLVAQTTGSLEFTARVASSGGRPEPVREMTFSLLSKSLDDIRQEALQTEPAANLDKFIDDLKVSPKLREWMKKHHSVQLSGPDFSKGLTADEIIEVPEFFSAYLAHNAGLEGTGFPNPKFHERDRAKDPDKYAEMQKEYIEQIRKYLKAEPDSAQGLEAGLDPINPNVKWENIVAEQHRRLEKQALELAQTRYLVAQSDTNLDGRGFFANLPTGNYWIGMLGMQAMSGDVRLQWDVPVAVRAGQTARVDLSNFNAAKPHDSASASNR
jgi:hypothetical protein